MSAFAEIEGLAVVRDAPARRGCPVYVTERGFAVCRRPQAGWLWDVWASVESVDGPNAGLLAANIPATAVPATVRLLEADVAAR